MPFPVKNVGARFGIRVTCVLAFFLLATMCSCMVFVRPKVEAETGDGVWSLRWRVASMPLPVRNVEECYESQCTGFV